jgi:hypothetical protein
VPIERNPRLVVIGMTSRPCFGPGGATFTPLQDD